MGPTRRGPVMARAPRTESKAPRGAGSHGWGLLEARAGWSRTRAASQPFSGLPMFRKVFAACRPSCTVSLGCPCCSSPSGQKRIRFLSRVTRARRRRRTYRIASFFFDFDFIGGYPRVNLTGLAKKAINPCFKSSLDVPIGTLLLHLVHSSYRIFAHGQPHSGSTPRAFKGRPQRS
jgi:hypothetical protein